MRRGYTLTDPSYDTGLEPDPAGQDTNACTDAYTSPYGVPSKHMPTLKKSFTPCNLRWRKGRPARVTSARPQ